jgi:hypothetical protein
MKARSANRVGDSGGIGTVLRGALAMLLLVLPVADAHAETSLAPVAPGSLIASAALHPGAAKHFESSATTRAPRCPACDLAQQTAAALGQAMRFAVTLGHSPAPSSQSLPRAAAPLAPALSRGPPSH